MEDVGSEGGINKGTRWVDTLSGSEGGECTYDIKSIIVWKRRNKITSPRAVVTMRLQEGIFADFLALTKARQYLSTSLSGKYTFDGTGHSLSGRYQKISVIEYLSLISAVNFDLEMHT